MSFKKRIASIVGKTPLWRIGEIGNQMPRILFYHGVIDTDYSDPRVQANQIPKNHFVEQIDFLRKNYTIISLDEFYSRYINHDVFSGKEIVITFDDGYKNNYTVAAPILFSYGIPFSIFVSTSHVSLQDFVQTYYVRSAILSDFLPVVDIPTMKVCEDLSSSTKRYAVMNRIISFIKTSSLDKVNSVINEIENQLGEERRACLNHRFESERILSWKEISELASSGVIIGSHSMDHCILHHNQDLQTIQQQLIGSKEDIVNHLGKCDFFAFPNGDRNSVCELSIKETSNYYKMGFAVNGKRVSYRDPISFVSRIDACFTLELLKVQLGLLSRNA